MVVGEHRLPVLPVLAMSRLLVLLLLVCLLLPAMAGTAVAGTRIVASLYPLAMVSMQIGEPAARLGRVSGSPLTHHAKGRACLDGRWMEWT